MLSGNQWKDNSWYNDIEIRILFSAGKLKLHKVVVHNYLVLLMHNSCYYITPHNLTFYIVSYSMIKKETTTFSVEPKEVRVALPTWF